MRHYMLLLGLLYLAAAGCAADGDEYFMYADFWCALYSREQLDYMVDWYFNKEFTMQYNSTVGNWTGLTRAGLITAALLNGDQHDVLQRKLERQLICVNLANGVFNLTEENMAKPSVTVGQTTSSGHDTMVVCSAYSFYPKQIKLTWHLNGQEVTSGVTVSDAITNGDWTYQRHSYLEYTPGRQDTVSCVVEHATLKEPMINNLDTSLSQSERSYLIGGGCALLLGGVFLSLGLMHYRKKSYDEQFSSPL